VGWVHLRVAKNGSLLPNWYGWEEGAFLVPHQVPAALRGRGTAHRRFYVSRSTKKRTTTRGLGCYTAGSPLSSLITSAPCPVDVRKFTKIIPNMPLGFQQTISVLGLLHNRAPQTYPPLRQTLALSSTQTWSGLTY
jgi:hypothetical protein